MQNQLSRKAVAGMNVYNCPTCKGMKRTAVFVPVNMTDWALIQTHGAVTRSCECQNGHTISFTLECPRRVDNRYLMRRRMTNAR
ncbi:MAG: hypothetical protein GY832_11340 [Chloroflexi bacterium]|nr:hypothetical protein [Chloroflexota bacterium]